MVLLYEKLRSLRQERGLSITDLSHATARVGDTGVGERTIQLLESTPGRVPEAHILEALARALKIKPDEFYEYPIASARRAAAATPEARKKREADALRKRAQRRVEHQPDAPDATPAPQHRKGQGH